MVILYGGSFNPPTIAHYEIAKYLIKKYPEAEFLFLPTNNFYKKDNLRDFHYRCDMLEIVCKKLYNKAKISYFELELDQYYGTDYTLKHFKDPYFVMGADNLQDIAKWINYPNVVKNNKFIIIPRDEINIELIFKDNLILQKYRKNFIILTNFHKIYISSSEYRKTKNDDYLLEEVAQYIHENNLYKE